MSTELERRKERYRFIVIALLLAGDCFLIYYFHIVLNTQAVFTHTFYIPIILASYWWKRKGTLVAIFLSAVILSYHFIFRSGLAVSLDIIRAIMFVVISWVVAILSERIDKNKEAEIRHLAQKNLILESAGEGILGLDSEGKHTFVNPAAAKMLGYEVDELIGRHSHSTWHHTRKDGSPYPEGECLIYAAYVDGHIHRKNDEVFWRKDGTSFPVGYFSTPILEGDKLTGAVVTFRDITERLKTEKAFRDSEERFRRLFETSRDGLLLLDKETEKIVNFNLAMVTLMGYSSEEFIGKRLRDIGLLKDITDFHKIIQRLNEVGFIHYDYVPVETKEGQSISTEIYLVDRANFIQCNIRDITERRKADEERKKLQTQLYQSQKMEGIGLLAGGIAHDFNNIISAMLGFGTLMQMNIKEDDPVRHYLDQLLTLTEKATTLTQSLLAFSRNQPINVRPVKLNAIVSAFGKLLLRLIGEDIQLNLKLSDKDIVVLADSGQIEQILMNLATNARDAMPEGGILIISTEPFEMDDNFVMIHGYGKKGQYALISVEDAGMGMDDKTMERIFEPFFTTKEVGKGTGLGLAIVYGIVKQHDGYINVYSEHGKGTIFRIYLPRIDMLAEETNAIEQLPLTGGTETILFVEDEAALRNALKTMLMQFGYKVIEAEDGEDAVNKFIKHKDEISIVIMDVIMPKKNGREAYEALKGICPDVKVIFTSGYTGDVLTNTKILEEGLEFISKPVSPRELFWKIRDVLDKGKP